MTRAQLPNGDVLDLPDGATGMDAARAIGEGLARAAIAIEADGELRDLARPLSDGGDAVKIRILTERDPEALEVIRHDAAHVLAAAVKDLYPGTKISIGPPIDDGFYYDFDFPEGIKVGEEDLDRIEQKMREHIKADEKFERTDVSAADALERFKGEAEDYKVELIQDLGADSVSLYQNGPFTDLCRGPHGPGTKRIKAIKLTSVAGAYWRGDSNRPMLTRIYGTAFFSKDDLAEHLQRIEEAKARDHRKLGRELGLFEWDPVSPGSTFWLPKGTKLFNQLVALNRQMQEERGYVEVKTPQIYESQLWETSGHWGKYKENIFTSVYEDREFGIKPMNCPGHCALYGLQRWSYRDLPFRCAEPGLLHRREPSGTLHGLLRVRHFVQDDAHVFCREDQVQEEVARCLEFGFDVWNMFGFETKIFLSTRPEPDKRLGDDAFWDRTEGMLRDALEAGGYEYEIAEGDGAFYAPKIDVAMRDSLGREWQLGTVQLDYNLPERFGLTYAGADNQEHRPVMIHRALFGSFERFIGILLEHTAGELPFWLAPVQAKVLPVADRHADAAAAVAAELRSGGLHVEVDDRTESLGKKIRSAELEKTPYMLVVGDRYAESGEVGLRKHKEGDVGELSVADVISRLAAEAARPGI